ncbi:Trigger factor-like protein TIG- Chloroplastic [Striga hermonthica]|uniref:peptidylprolyl isomerase n=1 Tax=Striga hermonthica TaxID=68872 RepID=A0A9N7NK65_STRHE|nr:Trigger factor-like protein TIG- Chloroplastic [Striga hermonthica]
MRPTASPPTAAVNLEIAPSNRCVSLSLLKHLIKYISQPSPLAVLTLLAAEQKEPVQITPSPLFSRFSKFSFLCSWAAATSKEPSREKMAACCSRATPLTFFHFTPASVGPSPNSVSFVGARWLKPITKTRQYQLHSRTTKFTRFLASASPATADNAIADKLPGDLQVTETPEPNSRVRLSVEVPAVVCDDCYKKVIDEFMKRSKVPGFRPGKNIPESILVGFVGKKNVQKATIESILKRTLPHAMSSVSGRALEDSLHILTRFPDMESTYSSMKSLRYDVIVDVAPEVKWVPEDGYKNLKIVVEIDKEIDAQTATEQELRRRHKALGALKIVADRGLEVGDVAVLDLSATTIDQDESTAQRIPSAESKGFQFDTEDENKVLPDFLNSIIGIKRGETKSFPYVFPDSWKQEDLRGVQAQFTVYCKELFYRDLPELNDSIADRILSGCSTIEEVKAALLQKFIEVEQTAKEQATDNAILDQLQKMIEVDIPLSLFEEQGRQLYGAQLLQIQILTDELVKEVENSIAEFKRHNQEYDEERVKGQVEEVLEGAKVLEWLRERAEIQYITKGVD